MTTPWNIDNPPRSDREEEGVITVTCPNCGAYTQHLGQIYKGKADPRGPEPGHPVLCVRCKTVSIYDPALPGACRLPLAQEEELLSSNPLIATAQGEPVPIQREELAILDDAIERLYTALQTARITLGIAPASMEAMVFTFDTSGPEPVIHLKSTMNPDDAVKMLTKYIRGRKGA